DLRGLQPEPLPHRRSERVPDLVRRPGGKPREQASAEGPVEVRGTVAGIHSGLAPARWVLRPPHLLWRYVWLSLVSPLLAVQRLVEVLLDSWVWVEPGCLCE